MTTTDHPPAAERGTESDFAEEIEIIVSTGPPPGENGGLHADALSSIEAALARARQPGVPATATLQALPSPGPEDVVAELRARIETAGAPLDAARMLVELGIHAEWAGDRTTARQTYQDACARLRGFEPALRRLRRFLSGKAELTQALAALDDELAATEDDGRRADLLAERARVCEALERPGDARAAYGQALDLAPEHAASLWSLDRLLRSELERRPDAADVARALASHLERMAKATTPRDGDDGDARLAAWLLVERADLLEAAGQNELARAAHDAAVRLVGPPGPIRDARTRFLCRQSATRALVESLASEAELETDRDRAARLLVAAAQLAADKLADRAEARRLLTSAQRRALTRAPIARTILDELGTLLDADGMLEELVDVRLALLDLATTDHARAHEHLRLAELLERLGRTGDGVAHAERAHELRPESAAIRDRLDRMLANGGEHARRAALWSTEAGSSENPIVDRVAAYRRAAEISLRELARPDEALAHLRAAWAIDAGNADVFHALSSLLAAPPASPERASAVRERADLYIEAARAAKEPERRIGLLELAALLFEEELGDPARAAELLDRVLEIDGRRRSAIIALARNAEIAGDAARLARALVAEATLSSDVTLQRALLLRAAEVLADRAHDPERGLALVDQALHEGRDARALSMRARILRALGRYEQARKDLLAIIARDPKGSAAFDTWIEVALIDEHHLRRPADAVNAYLEAKKLSVDQPLCEREIVRLLGQTGRPAELAVALVELAAIEPEDAGRLMLRAARVQETLIGDDEAALETLGRAEALANPPDPAVFEAMERIFVRHASAGDLMSVYDRWLASSPPEGTRVRLEVALGALLAQGGDAARAKEVLRSAARDASAAVPALRALERLERRTREGDRGRVALLTAELESATSKVARSGLLWELAWLREPGEPAKALMTFDRLATEAPTDAAALDALVRVGGRLLAADPSAHALRQGLVSCLEARRALVADATAQSFIDLERALLLEADADEASVAPALAAYRSALRQWPDSLLAARGCERLAARLGDRDALLAAHETLARLVEAPSKRAAHMIVAAELTLGDGVPGASSSSSDAVARAITLFEKALRTDAHATAAAVWLTKLIGDDPARLVDRFADAFERARTSEAIVLLGTELARHLLASPGERRDYTAGIAAMRRVVVERPNDAAALILLARLLSRQRLWSEARDVLETVRDIAAPAALRVEALLELASLNEGPLTDSARAQAALEAAIAISPEHGEALDRLQRIALSRGDAAVAGDALRRRIATETDPAARVEGALRLADLCKGAGDSGGATRALCDAILAMPDDPRPLAALSDLHPIGTMDGASAYAAALEQLLDMARERAAPVDGRWLTALGSVEIGVLARPGPGLRHLEQAARLPSATPAARFALGRGLAAAARDAEAVDVLRAALADAASTVSPDEVVDAIAALESSLSRLGRGEERRIVEDVLACMGALDGERTRRVRARQLAPDAPRADALAGANVAALLLPHAKTPMLEVARALAPVMGKIVPREIALSSRDRLGSRDASPSRALADRIAAALGVERFELYVSPSWTGKPCVLPGDPPAIVAPTWFAQLPEPEQTFALAQFVARIALGATWLDELSPEAADAVLFAAVAVVEPSVLDVLAAPRALAVREALPRVQRAIGRRQRKLLEEIAPRVDTAHDAQAFATALRRSEHRVALALSPTLLCALDYLGRFDDKLAHETGRRRVLLEHPALAPLIRHALGADAFAARRAAGTIAAD